MLSDSGITVSWTTIRSVKASAGWNLNVSCQQDLSTVSEHAGYSHLNEGV
jgi:hypothetical protein